MIGANAGSGGASRRVSGDGESLGAVRESSAGSGAGQKEDHGRARYGLVIFVLHLHDRFTIHTLLNIIERAFSLDNDDIQLGRVLRWFQGLRADQIRQEKATQKSGAAWGKLHCSSDSQSNTNPG